MLEESVVMSFRDIKSLEKSLREARSPKERNKIFQRIKKLKMEQSCIVKS
jgi:hypothetical protein